MAEDLTGGNGRHEEDPKGKAPHATPAEIPQEIRPPISRAVRLGIEDDEPDSDALGG